MPRCTWLYVLGSDCTFEESFVYVGMTYRLVTRMNEHYNQTGKGAHATQNWRYDTLLAVYKIDEQEEHDHAKENELTTQLMRLKGAAWWKVRGGSSTNIDKDRQMPASLQDMRKDDSAMPRTCFCTLPCVRKVSNTGRPYLTCAARDMQWLENKIPQDISDGCSFFDWVSE